MTELMKRRFLSGMSQVDLARRAGISQSQVSCFENGLIPNPELQERIAGIFHCNVSDIFPALDPTDAIVENLLKREREREPVRRDIMDEIESFK
ncbi:MAG TPA: hypothetical protein DDX84_04215 [Nitrospiraceae bacterium]|nr:hypothetical protein [Nitrospiraceae bacterium]HKZ56589.1 helix-turn-helix transcriptional regulator [Thermodesulfovibrionales bacterium]